MSAMGVETERESAGVLAWGDAAEDWPPRTMAEVAEYSRTRGGHFFDRMAMRFFDSRLQQNAPVLGRDGRAVYFVTSERFHGSEGSGPRLYSVRRMDMEGECGTVGAFQDWASRGEAVDACQVYAYSNRKD